MRISLILSGTPNKSLEIELQSYFHSYPKPLIKRYDFIKGFEEGYLEFSFHLKKEIVSLIRVLVIE